MITYKNYYENFLTCGGCYENCYSDEKMQCSLCNKYYHRSCIKITERQFKKLTERGVDKVICSSNCCAPILPFSSISVKAFLDINVGKRKMPCKLCQRECYKKNNCRKCDVCHKFFHLECLPETASNTVTCSIVCHMKTFPFFNLREHEFCDEMSFIDSDDMPETCVIPTANMIEVNSTSGSNLVPNIDMMKNYCKHNDCEDSFNQIYCDYVSQNDVPNVMDTGDPTCISIFHGNVISLGKNLDRIEETFSDCKNYPSILAISETGLNDDIESEQVTIKGYRKPERNDSSTSKGGVGLYVAEHLDYVTRDDLKIKVEDCEDLWLEIINRPDDNHGKNKNDNSFIIGVIYRRPGNPYRSFSHKLCQNIEKLNKKKIKFMIVGDFNIDLMKYNLARNITDYANKVKSSGCNIHCNLPTRITRSTRSCIDHVYSNFDQYTVDTSVILTDISDHFSTLSKFSTAQNYDVKPKNVYKRKFKLNSEEEKKFVSDLDNLLNNVTIKTLSSCPNIMAKILIQSYQNLIDKYFPLKKVSKKILKFISKPWLTKGLKISIKTKNKLNFKLRKKYTEKAERYFRRYRNILTKVKKKAFHSYYAEKAAAAKNDIGKTWQVINEIIRRKKKKESSIFRMHDKDGNVVHSQKGIANLLNCHFSTIGSKMAENIPATAGNPLSYIRHSAVAQLHMTPTTVEEIMKLIDDLDEKKSSGSDGISCHLIKLSKFIIAPILVNLFNSCMYLSVFPDILKIAEVIPLFKGGNMHILGNYRPISLLPIFGKLLEKVIAKRLTDFLDANNILSMRQFGFRKSHSTELAAVGLYDHFLDKLDKKEITCSIFLDLAKAFDSVNHQILLAKLHRYNVRGPALDLFRSYLLNRWQYVKLNDTKSEMKLINIGIPQGSILGPLLFLLYINDLPNASNFFTKLFADDTVLSLSSHDFEDLNKRANTEIDKIFTWLRANKLTLNIGKSKFMIITNKRVQVTNKGNKKKKTTKKKKKQKITYKRLRDRAFNLKINGTPLERCSSYKYLGLHFDDKLDWKIHVDYVAKKVSKMCRIVSKLRHSVDINILKTVYYALGYSYLRYGNIVWGNAAKSVLEPLVTLQNRIIRIMTFAPFGRVDLEPVYRDLKILGLPEMHFLEKAKFMHKHRNGKLPTIFDDYFRNSDLVSHSYNLRRRNPHRQILSTYAEKMIRHNGLEIWNAIPNDIQSISNIKTFSFRIKRDILLV